jgi:hypothetical protein
VTVIGVISPGAMGSGLADALARGGQDVVATVDGRSPRTRRLAAAAPFRLLPDLAAVVDESDVVLSVVPPAEAPAIAAAVAHATASSAAPPPLLVDMNAVSPATLEGIERTVAAAGGELVDGSISGPPPWRPLLTARANGVLEAALGDLRRELPDLMDGAERWLAGSAAKSARYVGEMREIAATQRAAGLPPAVFEGIAEAYDRIATTPAAGATPEQAARAERLGEVLDGMAGTPVGDQ